MSAYDHPCPNQPTTGLQRLGADFKQCPSPWICEKVGCQFVDPKGLNAPASPGRRRRPLRERIQHINKLLGKVDG